MGYVSNLYHFLSGAVMTLALVSAVFFFKFWMTMRERLFLRFGIAFLLVALERLAQVLVAPPNNENHFLCYLIRLAAFLVILYAIIEKNRGGEKPGC